MEKERSHDVVEAYKQDKLNVSVYVQIKQLLSRFEEGYESDRKMAWIGLAIVMVLVMMFGYIFLGSSEIRVS